MMKNTNLSQLYDCDILVGVQLSDRNVDVPLYAPNCPTIRFASSALGASVKQLASEPYKVKFASTEFYCGSIDGAGVVNKVNFVRANIDNDLYIDVYPNDSSAPSSDIEFAVHVDVIARHKHATSASVETELVSEASINKIKFTSSEIGHDVGIVEPTIKKESETSATFGATLEMTGDAGSYVRQTLSDLESMSLSDLSNTTLQELYWIETQ